MIPQELLSQPKLIEIMPLHRDFSPPLDKRQNCIVFFTHETELFCIYIKKERI
jgi:hypothetical protein